MLSTVGMMVMTVADASSADDVSSDNVTMEAEPLKETRKHRALGF